VIHLASLSEADVVVSDAGLSPEYQAMLEAHGVQVFLA
jgi:DeoR/GlpR family transcriptional regulator of sugar metabolism